MKNFALVLALLFLATFGSGCVSQSKYRMLESSSNQEIEKLRNDLSALQGQKKEEETAAANDKNRLQEEISALKSDKSALEAEKATLEKEMSESNDRMAGMEKEAARIKSDKEEEINRLKGTYNGLVNDLKGEIEKGEIKVTQIRNSLSVNLVEKILFDSGRAEIKPKGKEVLKRVANTLRNIKDKEIRIEGFTDNVPIGESLRDRFPTNWELSSQRATNVLRYLEEEGGVDGHLLSAVGYGPYHPKAGNDTPEGRSENRRIEILLAPKDFEEVFKNIQ